MLDWQKGDNMKEYIIVGDTEKFGTCLVTLGGRTEESVKARLKTMLECPTDVDLKLIKGFKNLRIEEVEEKDQWWNDRFLMSD